MRLLALAACSRCAVLACLLCYGEGVSRAAAPSTSAASETVKLLSIEGRVEIAAAGTTNWVAAKAGQALRPGDLLRTDKNSRALLQSSRLGEWRIRESSSLTIGPPRQGDQRPLIELLKGFFYFFNRDKAIEVDLRNRLASATTRGTEFLVKATEEGAMEVTVLEGGVDLRNAQGTLALGPGEQGLATPGQPPRLVARIDAWNVIQWCLYYPAILDLDELALTPAETEALADSLRAYRSGDILGALQAYPADRQPASDPERVYRAALFLAVGEVEQANALLDEVGDSRLAEPFRQLIAAVQFRSYPERRNLASTTDWIAESYYRQSRASIDRTMLEAALDAARTASAKGTNCGFAWERLAELEFSFGNIRPALRALDKALTLSAKNAQALALRGFLLSAQNRMSAAQRSFEEAIAADSGLANGWLGRGLCRIHEGRDEEGQLDLLTAAALEPKRSLLRSYLGKAFTGAGDDVRAAKELAIARELDPKDPTSWLYSSLLKQQENRINEAIADLEASEALNDNRSLFRSRLLLDEDRAVKSANLASIYRDAGMTDVSVREAARAVTYDYANYSAHLFLSDSYNELRDPTRFNLRYETVWFNELLLANLLSPIGGGRLPLHVSQQEYSSLFQQDGLHLANSTLYRSDNKSVSEQASQYGTVGWTSYSLDLNYQHNEGVNGRPNNDLDNIEWYSTVKQQITPQDTLLAIVKYEDFHSGDNFQYYNPANARKNFTFDENQKPIVVGAWHHEWAPGVHTLAMGGRFETDQTFKDKQAPQLALIQDLDGHVFASDNPTLDVHYDNQFEIYLTEVNQIFQWEQITLSTGGRYQWGDFQTHAQFTNPGNPPLFSNPAADASFDENFERLTGYGYLTIEPIEKLWLTGGAAYDDITYPQNFRNPPLSGGDQHNYQLGPKAGVVWSPISVFTVRGDYTKSLGGVSEDESFRLEQTQVAGFPQAFRSLIPESLVGSVSAPEFETYGAALDLKFPTRTYAGVQFQRLKSDVDRTIGYFLLSNGIAPFTTASTPEHLDYREDSVTASINQLLGDWFTVGTSFQYAKAKLDDLLPDVSTSVLPAAHQQTEAELYTTGGYVLANHPSGLFARAEAYWYHQHNSGYSPSLPDEDFVQENVYLGYRFARRRVEIMFGILNLSNQDYNLNPLTLYAELPRERSYIARIRFVF